MITDPATGARWGTAAEIAHELCLDPATGPERVRGWGRRGLLDSRHAPGRGRGTRLFPLDAAFALEGAMSAASTPGG